MSVQPNIQNRPQSQKGKRTLFWSLVVNNYTAADIQHIKELTQCQKIDYVLIGKEHSGQRPEELIEGIKNRKGQIATWTPHLQCYIQLHVAAEATAVRKLITGHWEPAQGNIEQNKIYCSKGDQLTIDEYPTLTKTQERIVNPPNTIEFGTERTPPNTNTTAAQIIANSTVAHKKGEATKKQSLLDRLQECKTLLEMNAKYPDTLVKHGRGIQLHYSLDLKAKECHPPITEWHFGDTRCGKTYAAYISAGGKSNKNCHYQNGTLDWMTSYAGEEILFLNEYRCSNKLAFTNLLSIMEGFPADIPIKGGFTPIRINKLIITCPRPPIGKDVEMFGITKHYRGEYESQDKYDINHQMQAWEDVHQIEERIKEFGGTLICHDRQWNAETQTYRYETRTIIGPEPEISQLDPMSQGPLTQLIQLE